MVKPLQMTTGDRNMSEGTILRQDDDAAQHLAPNTIYSRQAQGADLSVIICKFTKGTTTADVDAPKSEEVTTVTSGKFKVKAGAEEYLLREGDAIIVPPGLERLWECIDETGSIIRIITPPPG
jgi:quercetin dioxygenase-like cupin family protein